MRTFIEYLPFIYIAVISFISFSVTCYDKIAAKIAPGHRTPESVLLTLSILGGSVIMLITMLIIRHKTKHPKFMIGIPVIIVLQLSLTVGVWFLLK